MCFKPNASEIFNKTILDKQVQAEPDL